MKVLILDDSRTDAYLASKVAKEFFSDVVAVGTPGEFKNALGMGLPDLILMDIHIGDLHNGISEIDEIRRRDNEASILPIFVVTASTDAKLHAFAMENGATAVLVKPLTPEALEPHLREHVRTMTFAEKSRETSSTA